MMIRAIVEGYGDVAAIPVLLRRLLEEAGVYEFTVGTPIRQHRGQIVQKSSLQKAVRLALCQPDCSAILVVIDSDDDCPKELAPRLETWAREEAGRVPCAVVMAHREYEAWLLAGIEGARGKHGVRENAESHSNPEQPRDAKGEIESRMRAGRTYIETFDQPALTASFDMADAYRHCRSFRRMARALGLLVSTGGTKLQQWPPRTWQ